MMAILDLVGGIFGNGIGIFRDWLASKRKVAEAETETKLAIEKAKAEAAARVSEGKALHEVQWETIQAKASESSWKDEWFTIVLSAPFILSMVGLSDWADRAFEAMDKAPEWYTLSFLVAVGSSFGVRIWDKLRIFKSNGNGKEE